MTEQLSGAAVVLCIQPVDNFQESGEFAAAAAIKHSELLSHAA